MPTIYEAALLANHLYNQEKNALPPHWKIELQTAKVGGKYPWGYCAALCVNTVTQEAAIVHRGSKFTEFPDSSHNLSDDTVILSRDLPKTLALAQTFAKQCSERLSDDLTCFQIGHSLGGFYAHVLGYEMKTQVIAFDPLGSLPHMEQAYGSPLAPTQLDRHHSFFITTNAINSINSHPGHQYVNSRFLNCVSAAAEAASEGVALHQAGLPVKAAVPLAAAKSVVSHAYSSHRLENFIELLKSDVTAVGGHPAFEEIKASCESKHGPRNTTAGHQAALFPQEALGATLLEEKPGVYRSKMDKEGSQVTKDFWVASVANIGVKQGGHAVLIIEGLNDAGVPFVHSFDIRATITGPQDSSFIESVLPIKNLKGFIHEVNCYFNVKLSRYQFLIDCAHCSCTLTDTQGGEVIKSIVADQVRTEAAMQGKAEFIRYQVFGSKGSPLADLFASGEGVNCAEYLQTKFKEQGIDDFGESPKPKSAAGQSSCVLL